MSQMALNRIPIGKASLNLPTSMLLGMGVFIISALNRLLDNRKPAKTETKKFLLNQKDRLLFLKIIAGFFSVAALLTFLLPGNLWKLAVGITTFSGLCLWLLSRMPDKSSLQLFREPVYAIVFSVAVSGSIFLSGHDFDKESKLMACLFFLVVFQNFLLSSYFDAVGFPNTFNLATKLKSVFAKQILHSITFLIIAGCAYICLTTEFRYTQRLSVILMGMSVLQSLLLQKAKFLSTNKYKGMLVSLIFILPFLVL